LTANALSAVPNAPRKLGFLFVSLAVLVFDQWTKWLIEVHLPLHSSTPILGGLANFTHVRNTGVAFGLFAAQGLSSGSWLLTALGLGALAAVCIYFWRTPTKDRTLLAALALVVGGALGNLLDRLRLGYVVDFVEVYNPHLDLGGTIYTFPVFNVGDSGITIGVILILAGLIFSKDEPETSQQQPTLDDQPTPPSNTSTPNQSHLAG
jgi:signal peptidase II